MPGRGGDSTAHDFAAANGRWKSDVDTKLDRLVRFADAYEGYLEMCMEREADRRVLRKAVIEKTFLGFVWVCLGIVGAALYQYAKASFK